MHAMQPNQGLVVHRLYEYREIAVTQAELRQSKMNTLEAMTDDIPIQTSCISVVKRMKFQARSPEKRIPYNHSITNKKWIQGANGKALPSGSQLEHSL